MKMDAVVVAGNKIDSLALRECLDFLLQRYRILVRQIAAGELIAVMTF